jgi:hypothetical protein
LEERRTRHLTPSLVSGGHASGQAGVQAIRVFTPLSQKMKTPSIRAIFSLILSLGILACSNGGAELNSRPPTFEWTVEVLPVKPTKELYLILVKLGDRYGLKSNGDGATGGSDWSIQVFCGKNPTAFAHTARDGQLMLFQVNTYGFKRLEDYERYKSDMLRLSKQYGAVVTQKERKPLGNSDLLARAKYMNMDFTTQCQ